MMWPVCQRSVRAVLCAVALTAFSVPGAIAAPDSTANPAVLRSFAMLRLISPDDVVAGGQVVDKEALKAFYGYRHYALAWDADGAGLGERAAAVFAVLASADVEGLEPADYHVREIAALANATTDAEHLDREFLLTDGLIHYAADVGGGRLNSHQTDERYVDNQSLGLPEYLAASASLDPSELPPVLAQLAPSGPQYLALKAMLAQARRSVAAGGWSALPDGGSMHPGAHDPAVPALRQRLTAEGRVAAPAKPMRKDTEDLYEPVLSKAVALFQAEHGIKPDGVIGKDTRAALDLSAEARFQQIAVNLERLRWSTIPPSGRAIVVNLASYSLNVYQDGAPILTMPVVVGSRENPTPMIASHITTVVLNPNWTLPPNVIREMLPRIHGDNGYLASKGIARAESDGHVRLIQPPGPTNPLGHYKFIMPNDQDIYLHDSPDSAKFRYALRAYSHGCIRLGNPAALAALLLDDRAATLPDGGLDAMAQTWQTRHIALSKPVPVSLVYRTTWLDGDGHLVIGQDSYGRDLRLWKALHKVRLSNVHKVVERAAFAG
ncbi:MAG: putative peptidoglycan binding domain protein [Rhodospirillales bacterium]|nr:putative peptidoglycan binding domain protein [Rhodospirillales bacterium]